MPLQGGQPNLCLGALNQPNSYDLRIAIELYPQLASTLLPHLESVVQEKHQSTALAWAAARGHEELAKIIINTGVNVNTISGRAPDSRFFALGLAASHGNFAIVKLLLDYGADMLITDLDGATAFHMAAISGWVGMLELFLECGMDINAQTHGGSTALHFVTMHNDDEGNWAGIELLVRRGADISIADENGHTVLHIVAQAGDAKTMNLFLSEGKEVAEAINMKDDDEESALKIAYDNGNEEVVKLLLLEGAVVDFDIDAFEEDEDDEGSSILQILNNSRYLV